MKMTISCMKVSLYRKMTFMHEDISMQENENFVRKMFMDESAKPNFP